MHPRGPGALRAGVNRGYTSCVNVGSRDLEGCVAAIAFGPRRLSCGIVIVNEAAELLLCRVTGQGHWDLPKGGAHAGETPREAALRETREETGLALAEAALLDLGRFAYTARTDLHLFATLQPRLDPQYLHCESRFTCPTSGRELPEMDAFGWFAFDAVAVQCRPKLASVLVSRVDLRHVLERLRRRAAVMA